MSTPRPMSQPRFERVFIAVAATLALAIVGWAMVGARCSDELYARLLERARSAPTIGQRCRAMNALCLRGYWDARPTSELAEFLRSASPEVQAFVREAYGTLLADRTPGAPRSGC
jgi:hypothetical protein